MHPNLHLFLWARKAGALAILSCLLTVSSFAQCPIGSAYLWTTFTPSTPDVPVISTGTWKQNIIDINVVTGNTYSVGNCNAVNGTNPAGASGTSVTVRDQTSATVIAYASGPDQVCATFVATYTGKVRAYLYTDACTNGSVGFTSGAVWIGCTNPGGLASSNITINSATISWNPVTPSIGYEYVVDNSPGSPVVSGTNTTATSANLTGLALNTTYYFHVRSRCATANSGWVTSSFTTLSAYCLPPSSILFSSITTTSADILWSQMPHSTSYQYHIDASSSFVPTAANTITTTGFNTSISGLHPFTKYYVYLRSICLNGADSSWWIVDSFTTQGICKAPQVQAINLGSNDPVMTWHPVSSISNSGVYEYIVTDVITDPAFGTEIKDTTVQLHIANDGKDKYFHIRTKCNSQFFFSEWVNMQLRTTGISDPHGNSGIFMYPNPVKDVLTVETSTVPADATLQLTDIAGKVIKAINVTGHKTNIGMEGIVPGVYMLKYADASRQETFKVIKK